MATSQSHRSLSPLWCHLVMPPHDADMPRCPCRVHGKEVAWGHLVPCPAPGMAGVGVSWGWVSPVVGIFRGGCPLGLGVPWCGHPLGWVSLGMCISQAGCPLGWVPIGDSHPWDWASFGGGCPFGPADSHSLQCSFLPKFSIYIETKYEDNCGDSENVSLHRS